MTSDEDFWASLMRITGTDSPEEAHELLLILAGL
jgi:hypothetical protein